MVTAIVLMNIRRGQVQSTAARLAEMAGISEVYSVGGRFDLVAVLRVANNELMADLVTGQLARIDTIEHTETLLAFQSYSRHDLESMFSIGN
ncbi:MAG: Lrp/AsnC ligand binding domain-containing protein [Candidatus Competibacterales bacterium]|nr:Lrp/AsnC ligand binding domain-containing protein [Candidatus Competibacterales bacterium]